MTVFFYALLRSARQRMTESEADVALAYAKAAEAGNRAAEDALIRMMYEVLYDKARDEPCEPQALSQASHAGEL